MSGECDKCNGHALECVCENANQKFFYMGKFFDNEEDFWKYVNDFSSKYTDEEDFNALFDMIKKDVWCNLNIYGIEITNSDLRQILSDSFYLIINKIIKINNYMK